MLDVICVCQVLMSSGVYILKRCIGMSYATFADDLLASAHQYNSCIAADRLCNG